MDRRHALGRRRGLATGILGGLALLLGVRGIDGAVLADAQDASPPDAKAPGTDAIPVPARFLGEVSAGPGSLFVVVDVRNLDASPRIEVTMPAAGAVRQVAEEIEFAGDRLAFTVASLGVRGRFDGRVLGDGRYVGELTLAAPNQPDATAAFALSRSGDPSSEGDARAHRGRLEVRPGVGLEMTIVVADDAGFGPAATISIPAQGVDRMPMVVDSVDGGVWMLRLPIGMAPLALELAEDRDAGRLAGVLRQAGAELPLELSRVADELAAGPARPQHPEPPFPYVVREVEFRHPHGHALAGTLTIPNEASPEAPVPGVVLVSGSGLQDRDETIFGHKPFLVIADALTRGGIAVLRCDDRGVGGSGGDAERATTFEFATDADAATEFLKTQAGVDAARVGIVGHSEGGLVAPIVARWQHEEETPRDPLAFMVLLAGPGVPGREVLPVQMRRLLEAAGTPADDAAPILESQRRLLDAVVAEDWGEARRSAIDLVTAQSALLPAGAAGDEEVLLAQADAAVAQMRTPWMQRFLAIDPAPILAASRVPVLAINGTLDTQIDAEQNLPRIRAALEAAGVPHRIERLEGLNHLLQPARTGGIEEYGEIETTIDPAVLELLVEWITETTGAGEAATPGGGEAP